MRRNCVSYWEAVIFKHNSCDRMMEPRKYYKEAGCKVEMEYMYVTHLIKHGGGAGCKAFISSETKLDWWLVSKCLSLNGLSNAAIANYLLTCENVFCNINTTWEFLNGFCQLKSHNMNCLKKKRSFKNVIPRPHYEQWNPNKFETTVIFVVRLQKYSMPCANFWTRDFIFRTTDDKVLFQLNFLVIFHPIKLES